MKTKRCFREFDPKSVECLQCSYFNRCHRLYVKVLKISKKLSKVRNKKLVR